MSAHVSTASIHARTHAHTRARAHPRVHTGCARTRTPVSHCLVCRSALNDARRLCSMKSATLRVSFAKPLSMYSFARTCGYQLGRKAKGLREPLRTHNGEAKGSATQYTT
jgi:hypothetical protein